MTARTSGKPSFRKSSAARALVCSAGQLQYVTIGLRSDRSCSRREGRSVSSIEDEGPGVSEADASRIWSPFYRAGRDSGTSGGTGIGLAIVKRLTALHSGQVRVERGARGARFVVELPGATREQVSDAARVVLGGAWL